LFGVGNLSFGGIVEQPCARLGKSLLFLSQLAFVRSRSSFMFVVSEVRLGYSAATTSSVAGVWLVGYLLPRFVGYSLITLYLAQ